MSKTTKSLLIAAIVALVPGLVLNAGLVGPLKWDALYALLPAGAVFLGLFLISKVLERETQAYDLDHQSHPAADHRQQGH